MKLKLSPLKGLVGFVGVLSCTCQIATAEISLADKSLARIATKNTHINIQKINIKPHNKRLSLTPISKLDSLIDKAQTIRHAGGIFGKNVRPILKKHLVGFQYSTKW